VTGQKNRRGVSTQKAPSAPKVKQEKEAYRGGHQNKNLKRGRDEGGSVEKIKNYGGSHPGLGKKN